MLETTNYALYKKCPIPGVERFLAFRDNPVVDFDLIADTVRHAVVGKPFDSYSTPWQIGNIIRNLLEMDPRFQPYLKHIYVNRTGPQTCELNYKTHGVLWVHIKKKKGRSHRNYFGHWYCDWIVSDLTFEGAESETRPLIFERLGKIDEMVAEAEANKRKANEDAYAIYKTIRTLLPDLDHYKIISVLSKINVYSYQMRDRYEKETKGRRPMTTYIAHIDKKGRILLPKPIRESFGSSATIVWENQTSCGKIYPSNPKVVTVEVEVVFEPDEATMKYVWKNGVALLYLGICAENGWYTIRLIGKEDDVTRVLLAWGWDAEEAKDLIEGEA